MKKKLLTSADLQQNPPASIDLDAVILAPSALVMAERLGIPLNRRGVPIDSSRAGSSKSGGPGAGDYRLVRPEFHTTGQVPRFGNPTYEPLEPVRGSKAWREGAGTQEAKVRQLVMARLGPTASREAIEAGVREVLGRIPVGGEGNAGPAIAGSSPLDAPAPCGCPTTTPCVIHGSGAASHRGNDGSVHVAFPRSGTYLVRVNNGQARVSEVKDE